MCLACVQQDEISDYYIERIVKLRTALERIAIWVDHEDTSWMVAIALDALHDDDNS